MSLLSISHLSSGYAGGFTIRDVCLEVEPGTVVGIVGPNGSGKSTLLSTVMGDLSPMSGSISLGEKDLKQLSRRERACAISVVSQMIDPIAITLRDYVAMGRLPHHPPLYYFESSADQDVIERSIRLVGLESLANRYMTELSGGEQQMGAIAQALCVEPRLLLLDEATAHLDITHTVRVLSLVRSLAQDKARPLTIIAVLHDLTMASEYCDYLVLMRKGQVYAQGSPESVLTEEHIGEVYRMPVSITPHPISGRPMVLPRMT